MKAIKVIMPSSIVPIAEKIIQDFCNDSIQINMGTRTEISTPKKTLQLM